MQESQHNLKPGTIIKNYEIIRVLGEGGFGITYLARDRELGLEVVIKEYFPNEFAMRADDSCITAKSKSIGDFSKGMQRFKEEAQTLAKFSHPSIVKILGYFEANDTAYFVMEYEEGTDLSHYLKQQGKMIDQEEILSIMMPILEGLKEVHKHNYLHRDIKPGNILLRANHSPVLIDFGASKLAIGEASKSITSMLTEGYAPLEQYSTDIKQQGPFTDLYAVAAVIYKIITGKVPPSAQTRSYQLLSEGSDPFEPLMTLKLSGYDTNFLRAVDRALAINAKERPQNVQQFQKDIAGELKRESKPSTQKENEAINSPKPKNKGLLIGIVVLIIAGGVFGTIFMQDKKPNQAPRIVQNTVKKVTTEQEVKESNICDNGNVAKCYSQGLQYLNGQGVKQDKKKAMDFFKIACDNDDAKGCSGLGLIYAQGQGVKRDNQKALSLFKKACDGGNMEGCYNLGYMYDKGKGTKQDDIKSLEYYTKACNSGLAKSCYRLGSRYLSGKSVTKDYVKAKDLLGKSCDGGEARGCTGLGVIYVKGLGTGKDYTEARTYFKKACEASDAKGCFNLGRIYDKGLGIEEDDAKAARLYKAACDNGYEKGCKTSPSKKVQPSYSLDEKGIENIALLKHKFSTINMPSEFTNRKSVSLEFAEGYEYKVPTIMLFDNNNLAAEIRGSNGLISEIFIYSSKFVTKKGARVGMRIEEVLKLYPNAKIEHITIEEKRRIFIQIGNTMQFEIEKDKYIGKEKYDDFIVPLSELAKGTAIAKIRLFEY